MPMARPALSEDGAIEQVEAREQRGGAVAAIVVGHPLNIAEALGQQRLRALERLHLALLVDAQDQRLVGRVEVELDHVAQFLDQGSQFTSTAFTSVLQQAEVRISMDGRGRWLDNVFIERLWRSLKYEEVYLKGCADAHEARAGIASWFSFYNGSRPHQA